MRPTSEYDFLGRSLKRCCRNTVFLLLQISREWKNIMKLKIRFGTQYGPTSFHSQGACASDLHCRPGKKIYTKKARSSLATPPAQNIPLSWWTLMVIMMMLMVTCTEHAREDVGVTRHGFLADRVRHPLHHGHWATSLIIPCVRTKTFCSRGTIQQQKLFWGGLPRPTISGRS